MKSGDVNIIVQNLIDFVGKISDGTKPLSPSIYMAPNTLRDLSPSSFKPRVVSIGPLHRKDEKLQRFERKKAIYGRRLWGGSKSPYNDLGETLTQMTLTTCVQKVVASIEKIKGCYADNDIKGYGDMELAQMMVADASFIIEFIREISEPDKFIWLDKYNIRYDLVLLENQIPFFVLHDIFECTISQFEEGLSLTQFIRPLVKYLNLLQGTRKFDISNSYSEYDHVLGYLHACYKPKVDIPSYFPSSTIHSAVELDRAGVKFRPNKDANYKWPLAISMKTYRRSCTFCCLCRPTLRMPKLHINHFTELVLRNLIAYEQLSADYPYVMSYARAMDMLIDTHEDVAKLVRSKVVVNHLGSNEEAADMINRICKEVVCENFFYGKQWKKMDRHFNDYWPKKIVNLRRTYFSSPWSIIALFAGFVLFALTVVQTIFSVKSAGK
ncbi:hypothetical protein SSX86_026051 [Deinandra increscens subsp. villosa]|uniref:Uncharacterized protein n=1 Tax=Deinandra increscens subsp. villosa TaxID=3103831 RepID=A0AAP0GNL7_9ASTR